VRARLLAIFSPQFRGGILAWKFDEIEVARELGAENSVVYLILVVYLVDSVEQDQLDELNRPDRPDQADRPDRPATSDSGGTSVLSVADGRLRAQG